MESINLNDVLLPDLIIKNENKAATVKVQDLYNECVKFMYTYKREEFNKIENLENIFINNVIGDKEIIDNIPVAMKLKIIFATIEDGDESTKNLGF